MLPNNHHISCVRVVIVEETKMSTSDMLLLTVNLGNVHPHSLSRTGVQDETRTET